MDEPLQSFLNTSKSFMDENEPGMGLLPPGRRLTHSFSGWCTPHYIQKRSVDYIY